MDPSDEDPKISRFLVTYFLFFFLTFGKLGRHKISDSLEDLNTMNNFHLLDINRIL